MGYDFKPGDLLLCERWDGRFFNKGSVYVVVDNNKIYSPHTKSTHNLWSGRFSLYEGGTVTNSDGSLSPKPKYVEKFERGKWYEVRESGSYMYPFRYRAQALKNGFTTVVPTFYQAIPTDSSYQLESCRWVEIEAPTITFEGE